MQKILFSIVLAGLVPSSGVCGSTQIIELRSGVPAVLGDVSSCMARIYRLFGQLGTEERITPVYDEMLLAGENLEYQISDREILGLLIRAGLATPDGQIGMFQRHLFRSALLVDFRGRHFFSPITTQSREFPILAADRDKAGSDQLNFELELKARD